MAKRKECKIEIENTIRFQYDIFKRLNKHKVNFNKLSESQINKQYVEGKLELLEQLWVEFSSGHKELMRSACPEELADSLYVKEDLCDQVEELYTWFKCDLKTCLLKLTSNIDTDSTPQVVQGKSSQLELPKIIIPSFSGKYSEWPTFCDLFSCLVHFNEDLTKVQKFHYLKSYLTGEAEQLVKHISIAECN